MALTPDIRTQIRLGIGLANTAYFDSKIATRMRLVYLKELYNYTESNDFTTELNALSNSSDGINDEIDEEARLHGADAVTLVSSIVAGLCGLANLGTNPMSPRKAFSVVATSCITNFTLQHEVGHNMGLNHEASVGSGYFLYSYGYHSGTIFRTVMSTANECAACPRVNYFSNPDVLYKGLAMGLKTSADAHRAISEVAATISSYREGKHVNNEIVEEDKIVNKDCFIATAAFGTPFAADLFYLRSFRNHVLSQFRLGRSFINFYNTHSPPVAKIIAQSKILRFLVLVFLIPLIFFTKHFIFCSLTFGSFLILRKWQKKFIIGIFFLLIFSPDLKAQVALPPLDPAFSVIMPQATGWRKKSRGTIMGQYSQENREASKLFIESDMTRSGVKGGLSLASGKGAIDFIGEQTNSTRKHANGEDSFRETDLELHGGTSLFSIGKLGVGASYLKQVANTANTHNYKTNTISVVHTGYSLEIGKSLYPSLGVNYYRNERTNTVDNQWLERYLALALQLSEEFGPQVELSWAHSPRRRKAAQGDQQVNHHAETDVIRGSLEFKLLGYYLHLDGTYQKEQATSELDNSHSLLTTRIGVASSGGILPIIIGAYATIGQDNIGLNQDPTGVNGKTNIRSFEISSSYVF